MVSKYVSIIKHFNKGWTTCNSILVNLVVSGCVSILSVGVLLVDVCFFQILLSSVFDRHVWVVISSVYRYLPGFVCTSWVPRSVHIIKARTQCLKICILTSRAQIQYCTYSGPGFPPKINIYVDFSKAENSHVGFETCGWRFSVSLFICLARGQRLNEWPV